LRNAGAEAKMPPSFTSRPQRAGRRDSRVLTLSQKQSLPQ
jgi:hypothetical protein